MEKLSIGKRAVRKMALLLLDDDNGINIEAYGFLSAMLVETGNDDILDAVDVTESRAYVGEDFAEEELAKLEEQEESEKIGEAWIEDPVAETTEEAEEDEEPEEAEEDED